MPTNKKYLTISELQVDDKVIPMSTDPKEQGKTFIVTDLHPVNLGDMHQYDYKTVAVTLWEFVENHYSAGHHRYGREFTSRTMLFQLVERY